MSFFLVSSVMLLRSKQREREKKKGEWKTRHEVYKWPLKLARVIHEVFARRLPYVELQWITGPRRRYIRVLHTRVYQANAVLIGLRSELFHSIWDRYARLDVVEGFCRVLWDNGITFSRVFFLHCINDAYNGFVFLFSLLTVHRKLCDCLIDGECFYFTYRFLN